MQIKFPNKKLLKSRPGGVEIVVSFRALEFEVTSYCLIEVTHSHIFLCNRPCLFMLFFTVLSKAITLAEYTGLFIDLPVRLRQTRLEVRYKQSQLKTANIRLRTR